MTSLWKQTNGISEGNQGKIFTQADNSMLAKVLGYFGLSLIFSSFGAFFGLYLTQFLSPTLLLWGPLIIEIILILTSNKWAKPGFLGVFLFLVFTLVSGVTLFPILAIGLGSALGMQILIQSFLSASMLFLSMGIYGYITQRDLTKIGNIAVFGLIAIIIVNIINYFFFKSLVMLITSSISIVIFSIFTAWDIQKIKNGDFKSPIMAAIHLYLDFINLFVAIFNILMSLSRD